MLWGGTEEIVLFQKKFRLPARTGPHRLTVRALRSCEVFWDRHPLYSVPPQDQDWTEAHQIALPANDVPGEHSLAISVKNALGPAALLAYCDSLDVRTGLDWQEWDGKAWQPVTTLDHVELDKSVRRFPSSLHALATTLWWLGPLFLAVFAVGLWATRGGAASRIVDEAVECLALPMDRDGRVARAGGQQLPQAAPRYGLRRSRRTSITSISWPSRAHFPMPRTDGRCFRRRCFTSWGRSSIAA